MVDKPLIQFAVEEAIAGIDTLIFVTGRNKRAIEDHFDNHQELEMALRSKGNHNKADMVKNILPKGIECIFVRQPEQLGLGHAVLCAERAVGDEAFAVLLADDFITFEGVGVTGDLVNAFEKSGKTQLSARKYQVLILVNMALYCRQRMQTCSRSCRKANFEDAPSNLSSIDGMCYLIFSKF